MISYDITFENNGNTNKMAIEAEDKSQAIEKIWDLVGFMIVIKEIVEIGN